MVKTIETVSTSQLISMIAENFELVPKKVTKEIIQTFLATIENEVSTGKKLRINSVGILQVKNRAARKGRNPQTGKEIQIPASKKISFRVAKSLKEKVTGIKKTTKTKVVAATKKKK